jgi:hypothetical protein
MVSGEPAFWRTDFGDYRQKYLSELHQAWSDQPKKDSRRWLGFPRRPIMREGGYVRYDGRKSTQVLHDCEMLIADYSGSLDRLHGTARNAREVEQRLLAFHGVGPVTANIFLREMRPFWIQSQSRSAALRQQAGEAPRGRPHPL